MKRVQIDPAAMDDREMLEDLVVTAYTDAFKQAEAASQALMSGATAGMPMPPGFKLPF
jgi:DNA-binding protein YbaB